MVTITDDARRALKASLAEHAEHAAQLLRLGANARGIVGLTLDVPRPGDEVVECEGVPVLLIGPELQRELEGGTIDLRETPAGPRLNIRLADVEGSQEPRPPSRAD